MPREMNPLNWGRTNVPVRRQSYYAASPTFADKFFDDFLNNVDFTPSLTRDFIPSLDVSDDQKVIRIECELPGMEEKDVDLSLAGNILTIRGEKRSEQESRERGRYKCERRYGSFSRSVELPTGLDLDKVTAHFKNGVLSVEIPKTEEYQKQVRSIPIGEQKPTS